MHLTTAGDWCPTDYVHHIEEDPVAVMKSHEEAGQRLAGFSAKVYKPRRDGRVPAQCTGLYMLPLEYTTTSNEPEVACFVNPHSLLTFPRLQLQSSLAITISRGFF